MHTRYRVFFITVALLASAAGVALLVPKGTPPAKTLEQVAPAAGGGKESPALHKALYTLRMISVKSGAGISDVSGQMYYEQNDACEAWTTEHRFSTEYQYPERRPIINANHYVAWEAKDASGFYFSSERQENGEMTEQLRGSITKNPDGTAKADYSRPGNLSYDLPQGYLLPTRHTLDIIRHARAGKTFFDAVVFDGTDADGPIRINTFIGKKITPAELAKLHGAGKNIDPALLPLDAWHLRMAVFLLKEMNDMSPAYEMEMILHDNGVVSSALIDYKSFKIQQDLIALEPLPDKKCP